MDPLVVDGVPVIYRAAGGTTRATLSFRVGTADERLPQRGITQLLSYSAAAAGGIDSPAGLAKTSFTVTSFTFSGTAEDVAHEIGALCHSLRNLDPRLLERQRKLALGDVSSHSPEHSRLLRVRYGPTGWGADVLPQFGVPSVQIDTLRDWSAAHFTTGNAIVAISGQMPTNLRIPLPIGNRRPVAELSSSSIAVPAVHRAAGVGLSMGGVVQITSQADRLATGILATAVRGRVVADIQQHLGIRLGARTGALSLGRQLAHLAIWSDAVGGQEPRASDVTITALEALVADGLPTPEVDFYRDRRRTSLREFAASSRGSHALLEQEAVGSLLGTEWSLEQETTALQDISVDVLHRQAAEVLSSLVLILPESVRPPRTFAEVGVPAGSAPSGKMMRSRPAYGGLRREDRASPRRLFLGAESLTLCSTTGPKVQIAWSDLRLTAQYDDGRRLLMDKSSQSIDLRPEEWLDHTAIQSQVDTRAPADSTVQMGARRTPTPPRLTVTDRVPPWLWLPLALLCVGAVVAAVIAPWPSSLTWLRTTTGVAGFVLLFVVGAFGIEVLRSARLLRRPRR